MKLIAKLKSLFTESTEIRTHRNPVLPILSRHSANQNLEVIASRIGFALKIIFADGTVAEEEKQILGEILKSYLPELSESVIEISTELLKLDNHDLEMMYFAQVLNEKLSDKDRAQFLHDLFRIARADDEYAMIEESDIRIICKYLLLAHSDFIKMRNQE